MKLKDEYSITVTADDIEVGCRSSNANCPIAYAVRRLFGVDSNHNIVHVDSESISLSDKPDWWHTTKRFILPKKAKSFIKTFDKGEKVKPFKFTMLAKKRKRAKGS